MSSSGFGRDLLSALDEAQLSAVEHLRGPLRILAGAGTGKTRVITHRIAHGIREGSYTPNRVMALTFTAKAAGELRSRLRELGAPSVAARTFHATALAQINFFWPQLAKQEAPKVISAKRELLVDAAQQYSLQITPQQLREIAALIEWRKVSLLSIDQAVNERIDLLSFLKSDQLYSLLSGYERLKDERNLMDFEDVLLACAGMLEHEPHVLAQVREQYRHFTVDEFQDVSPAQFHLLRLWLGHRTDIAVVGDPQQTIYEFAGASAKYLQRFDRYYPGAKLLELHHNYRSNDVVVQAAARVFSKNSKSAESAVTIHSYEDESVEASEVAELILTKTKSNVPLSQMAVLYRNQSQAQLLRKELFQRGIPTVLLGQQKFFDIPEVQRAVRVLRANAAAASLSSNYLDQLRDVLRSLGYTDQKPNHDAQSLSSWLYLDVFMKLAQGRLFSHNYREFTDRLMQLVADNYEPSLDAVTLSTIHAAKGLEWEQVWLISLNEGLLPSVFAKNEAEIAQEQRLLYVALTRAKTNVYISWVKRISSRPASRSRFLENLDSSNPDAARTN